MDRGQLEHDFAEFRRTGGAAALGRVFDRAAPELLIVAGHVARDAASAEDLVQGTFLAACKHAQGWDPQRALMPWLVTILLNEASMQARRAARAPEPPQERPVPHPIETAEAHELADALAQATARLAAPYREVLALRLAHGLETKEIAHALGRPLETVKTQLRRGLELLRATLPQSLATGLALVLANERGLAAVRVAVLAQAHGGSSLVATIGGILLMKKLLAGAALLLALLGIATMVALFGSDSGIARPGEEPLASAATRGVGAAASRPDAAAATRESLAADSTPAAPRRSITGRCVGAEDRAPLAGVVARLTSQWADGVFRSAFGPPPAPATPVLTTRADGRFAFDARIVHGLVYRLELHARGRVPRVATLKEEELASSPDFGDIEHACAASARAASWTSTGPRSPARGSP
jgi:RNA polymerase sigma-70 factor (ECF subfamily)